MITFKCPGCGLIHRAAADFGGIRAKCLCCGEVMRVPGGPGGAEANDGEVQGAPPAGRKGRRPMARGRSASQEALEALAESETDSLEEPGAAVNGEIPPAEEHIDPEADTPQSTKAEPARPAPPKGRAWVKWAVGGGVAAVVGTVIFLLVQPREDKPVPVPVPGRIVASTPKPTPKPAQAPAPKSAPPPKPAAVVPPIQLTAAKLVREYTWDRTGTNQRYKGRSLEIQGVFIRLADGPAVARSAAKKSADKKLVRSNYAPLSPPSSQKVLSLSGGTTGVVTCVLAAPDAMTETLQAGEPITVGGIYRQDLRLEQATLVKRGAPADAQYRGKELEVSGMVLARGWADGSSTLELGVERTDTPPVRLECRFRASESSDLAWLGHGRFATVRGACTGRYGSVIRLDNSRVIYAASPGAGVVRVSARQLLEDYETDLRDGDEDRQPPLSVSAMDLVWQVQKEGTAALHRYYHRELIVTGNVERVDSRQQRAVFERDTQQRLQAAAMFTARDFQQLGSVRRLSIVGVFAGVEGKLLRLDNCRRVDPNQPLAPPAKDEWLTLDYWPFRSGRTLTYDTVFFNGVLGKTAVRKSYTFTDKDAFTVTTVRRGTFKGRSVLDAKHPGKEQWTTRAGKHHAQWHYRFEGGYVDIGTPSTKDPKGPPVWEPVLSMGLTTGDHWQWTDLDKHRATYTVESFRTDGNRSLVTIRKTQLINQVTVDTVSTYAAGVGEIERYTEAHSADKKTTRRLSEMKLVADEITPPVVKKAKSTAKAPSNLQQKSAPR